MLQRYRNQKIKEKSFAQTWQEAATPETQDPIGRVIAILERTNVEDAQLAYLTYLKAEKEAGRGDRQTMRDLSRAEAEYKKRMLDFSCKAPTYDGNPAKVFDWLENWRNIYLGTSVKPYQMRQ